MAIRKLSKEEIRKLPLKFKGLGQHKKLFLCGIVALAGVMNLSAEVILKDNLKINHPEIAAKFETASRVAYENDTVGFYRHLVDSKTDNMYVDVDMDGSIIGAGNASMSGDTMYIRTNFKEVNSDLVYHEAWHRIQELKMPRIDNLLPPYYAVFLNMVREAGANWYQKIIEEKTGLLPQPTIPDGMTEVEFNSQRFNKWFIEFLGAENYLADSLDGLVNAYKIRKIGKNTYAPGILNPDYLKYVENADVLMQEYMKQYSPDGIVFEQGLGDYLTMFDPILRKFDEKRLAEGQVTFSQIMQDLRASLDGYAALPVKRYSAGLSDTGRSKLDAIIASNPGSATVATSPSSDMLVSYLGGVGLGK
jgi:hypothetical protein